MTLHPIDALVLLCQSEGWPVPRLEYRFHPTRKWRFDYAWLEIQLAIERQGGVWTRGKHARGAGMLKDHEKLNAAQMMGWRVLQCTPGTIHLLTPYLRDVFA